MARLIMSLAVLILTACSSGSGAPANPLEQFTGTRTRVVWVQSDGKDPFAAGSNLLLMGLDSTDGKGERAILPQRGSYVKPMITPRGQQIVFSRGPVSAGGSEIMVTSWDGSAVTSLGKGFAVSLWQNPADATEWVYAGVDAAPGKYDFPTIVRFRIDNPGAREVVWNKTLVSADTFQVSPDGRHAGGLFPWPEAGVAELPNGKLEKLGDGCWTALASVRGPLMWYFDGAHRNLTLVDVRTSKRWTVNINGVPGFGNDEVYHPRWTNHPRFLVMSGPYNRGGDNQVRSGGVQTEVYLGRFSADYARVDAWHRVTTNGGADSYPDVWIERNRSPHQTAAGSIGPASAAARDPGAPVAPAADRIVVEARFVKAAPVPSPASIEPYRHALLVHEYEVTRVVEGQYTGKTILVAQWVIRDRKVLPDAQKAPGMSQRLTVERFDAHPELEGERVISASDTPKLTLYYQSKPD
ncbi:MAG: hypothetical protein H0W08_19720 [Acidobacteria bacterium]|nr:hypothetical protein [Acidobacteriota bacterium]